MSCVGGDDKVKGVQVAHDRTSRPLVGQGGDDGCEPVVAKSRGGVLVVPDLDDSHALVGWPGDVDEQPAGKRIDERCGGSLVLGPARRDVVDTCVSHPRSIVRAGIATV